VISAARSFVLPAITLTWNSRTPNQLCPSMSSLNANVPHKHGESLTVAPGDTRAASKLRVRATAIRKNGRS
jgi:hypothetical protein